MSQINEYLSAQVKPVLGEIAAALARLLETGESSAIFMNKMALTQVERQEIRDYLGVGSVNIKLGNTAEPAEWQESGISGVWYGVFYNQSHSPILETIEIAFFPQVAGVQPEDLSEGLKRFKQRLHEDLQLGAGIEQ